MQTPNSPEPSTRHVLYISDENDTDLVQTALEPSGFDIRVIRTPQLPLSSEFVTFFHAILLSPTHIESVLTSVDRTIHGRHSSPNQQAPRIVVMMKPGQEDAAAEALAAGADTHIVQDDEGRYLKLLPAVLGRALSPCSDQLTQQSRYAQAAADTIVDRLYVLDPTTLRFLYANEAVCDYLGHSRDQILQMQLWDIIPAAARERVERFITTLNDSADIVDRTEVENFRSDGTGYPAEIRMYGVMTPKKPIVVVHACDITSRRRAEAALRESETYLRRAFDTMIDGLALLTIKPSDNQSPADWQFQQVNPAFERLTGLSRSDVSGKYIREIPAIQTLTWTPRAPSLTYDGRPQTYRCYAPGLDRYFSVKLFHPSITQLAIAVEDITAQIQDRQILAWELQINAAMAELAQAAVSPVSLDEVGKLVLNKAMHLSHSHIGHVRYIDPESGEVVTLAMKPDLLTVESSTDRKGMGLPQVFLDWTVQHPEPILVNNFASHQLGASLPQGHQPLQRVMSAPIEINNELTGLIALGNADQDYGLRDLTVVRRLAALFALTIEKHRVQEALRQQIAQQTALYTICAAIAELQPSEDLMTRVITVVLDTLAADSGWINMFGHHAGDAIRGVQADSSGRLRNYIVSGDPCPLYTAAHQTAPTLPTCDIVVKCSHKFVDTSSDTSGYWVCVPIISGGRLAGSLTLFWDTPNSLATDQDLLKAIGQQVGIAIHNGHLYREARQVDRLRLLNQLDGSLRSTLDPDTIAKTALQHLTTSLRAPKAELVLCTDNKVHHYSVNVASNTVGSHTVDAPEQAQTLRRLITGLGQTPGQDFELRVWQTLSGINGLSESPRARWTPGDLLAPVSSENSVIGLIVLYSQEREADYNDEDRALVLAMARRAGQMLYNAHLYTASLEQSRKLEALNVISSFASSSLEPDIVLRNILQLTRQALNTEDGSVLLTQAGSQDAIFAASAGQTIDPQHRIETGLGIAGWVVQNDAATIVNDVNTDPRFYKGVDTETGFLTKSILCAPLRHRGAAIGVIEMINKRDGDFSEDDLKLLKAVAAITTVALENAHLFTQTRARAEELELLNEFSRMLSSTLNLDEVITSAIQRIHKILQADIVLLIKPPLLGEGFAVATKYDGQARRLLEIDLPMDSTITGWVLRHQKALRIADAQSDARYWKTANENFEILPRAMILVPMVVPGKCIGALCVAHREVGFYSEQDLLTLQGLAATLGVAMQNAKLYEDQKASLEERDQAQAQLIQAEKMAAIGRLTATLAHEINNPLQAIQGCLTLAKEDLTEIACTTGGLEDACHYLSIAEGEIDRISEIVQQTRDFYHPTQGVMGSIDVHMVLQDILALSNSQLQHSHVAVTCNWDRKLPAIEANQNQLKQVFLNCVLNAIDAMPDGGMLYIITRSSQTIGENNPSEPDTVHIEFTDTGCGIPEEIMPQLFEPLFTTKVHGSGLGLAVSYLLINAHQGSITVTSHPGIGTTIHITLPIRQNHTVEAI